MNTRKILWIIFGSVALVHIAAIALTTIGPSRPSFASSKKRSVVVKTIALNPSAATTTATPSSSLVAIAPEKPIPPKPVDSPPKPTPPKPKPAAPLPTPKKSTANTPPKTTPKPVETNKASSTQLSSEKKALLEKAQASLAKVSSNSQQPPSVASRAIPNLKIEVGEHSSLGNTVESMDYPSLIVGRIQSALTLPEHGKVEVALKIHPSGRVLKAEVISSSSQKNKQYVETQLAKLQFPPLGQPNGKEEFAFNLILTSTR